MKITTIITVLLFACLACKNASNDKLEKKNEKFDKTKWLVMEEQNYPYRNNMLKNLIDSVKLKGLKKDEVLNLLGQPSRTDSAYLFYNINRQHLGNTFFVINSKTLVIKFGKDSTVEWRKIHE